MSRLPTPNITESDSDCSTLTDLSSELSSAPSSPVCPPDLYPTPAPSQTQSNYSSSSEQDSRKRRRKGQQDQICKKRKIEDSKQRVVRHLNVRQNEEDFVEQASQLEMLLKALRKKKKIVVIAGAGISTSAGVPDFRSANGLFNTLRTDSNLKGSGKQLFDASVYQTDASTKDFHTMVRMMSSVVDVAKPTPFHHMLATLAHEGRLLRLYTQNVDGLDTELEPLKTQVPLPKKGPWPRTVQLHGTLKKMVCAKCQDLNDFDPNLFDGPNPPSCSSCIDLDKVRTEEAGKRSHGIGKLRPRMVLYHEPNPDDEAIGSISESDLRSRPDAIIVVGTTLEIPGVRRIVREMSNAIKTRKDGKCIWINRNPPPSGPKFDDIWDLVIAGDCDRVAELADMRKWYEEPREGVRVSDSDAEKAKAKESDVKVVVSSPRKEIKTIPGSLPTPLPSPTLKPQAGKTGLKLNFKPLTDKKPKAQSKTGNKPGPKPGSKRAPKSKQTKAQKDQKAPSGNTVKINATFKISKPSASNIDTRLEESKPFDPIPPQSARTNSIVSPLHETTPVKLEKVEVKGRLARMSEERISPTGAIPRGLQSILN